MSRRRGNNDQRGGRGNRGNDNRRGGGGRRGNDDRRGGGGRGGGSRGGGREGGRGGGRGGRRGGGRGGGRGMTISRPTKLISNFYKVDVQLTEVYQYVVDFRGLESPRLKMSLLASIFRLDEFSEFKNYVIFDANTIASLVEIDFPGQHMEIECRGENYPVKISFHKTLNSDVPEYFQLLNIALRSNINHEQQLIGRNYYNMDPYFESKTISVFLGYQTDITLRYYNGEPRFVLIADPISKIINKTTVYEILCHKKWPNINPNQQKQISRDFAYKGVYTVYNMQHHILKNVDFSRNINFKFTVNSEDGTVEKSYKQYFAEKYGCTNLDPNQPLLIVEGRRKQEICLVPELCVFSEIEAYDKRTLPKISSFKPSDRVEKLSQFSQRLNNDNLGRFMHITEKPIRVRYDLIEPPSVDLVGSGSFQVTKNFRDNLHNLKWPTKTKQTAYVTLVTFNSDCEDFAHDYTQEIVTRLMDLNSPVQLGNNIKFVNVKGGTHAEELKKLKIPTKPFKAQFIHIAYLSGRDTTDQYNELKNYSISNGIVNQGIRADKKDQTKKNGNHIAILTNIVIQIISKLGSSVWRLSPKSFPSSFAGKNIMMIGIDVYHSTTQDRKKQSVGVLVAGFIPRKGPYSSYIDSEAHEIGAEIWKNEETTDTIPMSNFIVDAINQFRAKPDIVIVYRDGVAESQLRAVIDIEFNQVIEGLARAKVENPDVLYTVVQKRIHTRFTAEDDRGTVGNPPPGTIVNDGTMYSEVDNTKIRSFYLISTDCNLSTVKPVHYIVLEHNDYPSSIPYEEFQMFTHYTTYLYPNWTDSVKLPYVTQIAHKTCYILGEATPKNSVPYIGDDIKTKRLFSL